MTRSTSRFPLAVLAVAIAAVAMWLARQSSPISEETPFAGVELERSSEISREAVESTASSPSLETPELGPEPEPPVASLPITDSLPIQTSKQKVPDTELSLPRPVIPSSSDGRGLFIRGIVQLPDGSPPSDCSVTAWAKTRYPGHETTTDAYGNFHVGPFDQEEVRITASSPSTLETRILPEGSPMFMGEVRAEAGGNSVIIQLLSMTGAIEGTVVDDEGRPIDGVAEISLSTPRFEENSWWFETQNRGEFFSERLVAGSYAVSATLADGRVGVARAVEVEADKRTKGVRVEVRRGSPLSLVYTGVASFNTCRIRVGDAVVKRVTLQRGLVETVLVPQGDLVVELREGRERIDRTVHVAEGGGASLVLP